MKKFSFRLEPLLRYREHLEKLAQQAVSEAHADVLACENRITGFTDKRQKTSRELEEKMAQGLSAEQYHIYSDYLSGLTVTLRQEEKRLKALTAELARKQAVLSRKSVEKKVLENLKERRKAEYYDQMAKRDQKETEDITIIRKVRGVGE